MLYREIMAVCSEIHTKHITIVCGQNVELLNVKLAVEIQFLTVSYRHNGSRTRSVGTVMRLPVGQSV